MTTHILITGGCGFVGHHFVEYFLKETDWRISVFDKLTYASNGFDRLRDINVYDDDRVTVFTPDITQEIPTGVRRELHDVNYICHLAAETHVDNSITDPMCFVMSNVVGTARMLEFARTLDLAAFHYFSTDEIFGPARMQDDIEIADGLTRCSKYTYREWDRYDSTNPYSATKAGGEELCLAYANTYNLPLFITHTMNCFGERQHTEKFIQLVINAVLDGKTVQIHSDSTGQVSGTRYYIHCRNVANAVHHLMDKFDQREKYNIVGEQEVSNLELALMIADIMGKELKYEMVDFHSSRPGHDLRYSLDGTKMDLLGWKPPLSFEKSLESTVNWMLANPKWLSVTEPQVFKFG